MSSMIVETKYGKLQGVKEDGCIVFKGVPYAMPPVGDLRFKAPRPPMPWDGVLKADAFSCRSAQNDINTPDTFYGKEFYQEKVFATPVSEDSLYLNLWVPEDALAGEAEERHSFPVAVYIHGGAFLGGCGHEAEFRTGAYGKKGVILVTINYRLAFSVSLPIRGWKLRMMWPAAITGSWIRLLPWTGSGKISGPLAAIRKILRFLASLPGASVSRPFFPHLMPKANLPGHPSKRRRLSGGRSAGCNPGPGF